MEFFETQPVATGIVAAVLVKKGQGKPVHKNRPSHGLAYNEGNGCVFRFENGKSLACEHGDLIYLPKGSNYTVEIRKDIPGAVKASDGTYAINFQLLGRETGAPFVVHIKGRDEMLSLFSRAVSAWSKKKAGYPEECFSLLYRILRLLRKETEVYTPLSRTLVTLAPALSYIEENYTSKTIPIERLASLAGISQPYFRRLFEAAFSVPPAVHIRTLRLKRAAELLATGEYTVTDAAVLSGFADTSYFSREFKKFTGLAPKDFLLGKN